MIETDDFNPYSSPGVPASVLQPIREARVDGRCIVVNSGTQLPLRCVTTNVDCSHDDLRARLLSYAPSFRLVVSRRRCRVFRCLSAARRKRHLFVRLLLAIGILPLLWFFCGMVIVAGILATTLFMALPPDRLKVVNYRNGEFWIEGFSEDFFDSLISVDGWKRV